LSSLALACNTVAQGRAFSGTITFDDLPPGSNGGSFGPLWITGSWYPWKEADNDCADSQAPNAGGRAITARFPGGDGCTDRLGIDVVQQTSQSRDGIIGLNFRPGWLPTSLSFEVRQHGGTWPVAVNAFDASGAIIWSNAVGASLWVVEIAEKVPIGRVEISCSQPFTIDTISYGGTRSEDEYDLFMDFESMPAEPFSGNFGVVHFTATDFGCSSSVGDSSAPGNGQRCLVIDGDNPRNAGPNPECQKVTDRNGVAIAAANSASDEPYARSFNGILTASFHPAARPRLFECSFRQHAVAGPVTLRARNGCGTVVFEQSLMVNSAKVSIPYSAGLGLVEFEGEHPFAIDDVHLVSVTSPGATDINGDGIVNGIDLGLILAAWSECPR